MNDAIKDLQFSEDPAKLGVPKKGELKNMYAYYLGKYRIIYDVYRNEIAILLIYLFMLSDIYGTD